MRRIYESRALRRDDNDRFAPRERDSTGKRGARRLANGTGAALSRRLVPDWLCTRAISIEISTPKTKYSPGKWIPFRVTMANSMPFPIAFRTRSPVLWTWNVDGIREASRASIREIPDEPGAFRFDRGERKRFTKRWTQTFRVSKTEWEPADPGEYTIGAGINVDSQNGLYDETTVRVLPETD